MGRGIALQTKNLYPWLPARLGKCIEENGNHVSLLVSEYWWPRLPISSTPAHNNLVSFPVKDVAEIVEEGKKNLVEHAKHLYSVGALAPGYHCNARLDIIERSCIELAEMANRMRWTHIVLTRPGCGAGGLNWQEVRPILKKHLDDRFYIYDNRESGTNDENQESNEGFQGRSYFSKRSSPNCRN